MFKVKSVSIHRPADTISFAPGDELSLGKVENKHTVEKIYVGMFNAVRVQFKSGIVLVYKGFPIVYEV